MPDPYEVERRLNEAIERGEITDEEARRYYKQAEEEDLSEREREWSGR